MDHTENETTKTVGASTATVICDSARDGIRLISVECVYPRIIHAEVIRHRVFSNSVSSSRATPVETLIKNATYTPRHWTLNQPGMVGVACADEDKIAAAEHHWNSARAEAIARARELARLGVHKQHVNRILEPFSFVRHLITSTEWDNFFALRLAPDADPEIQDLARAINGAIDSSTGTYRLAHAPYVSCDEQDRLGYEVSQRVSAARCARVSYMKHNGKKPTLSEDLALFERLHTSGHWSPMEHTATFVDADVRFANFQGWRSLRYEMQNLPF